MKFSLSLNSNTANDQFKYKLSLNFQDVSQLIRFDKMLLFVCLKSFMDDKKFPQPHSKFCILFNSEVDVSFTDPVPDHFKIFIPFYLEVCLLSFISSFHWFNFCFEKLVLRILNLLELSRSFEGKLSPDSLQVLDEIVHIRILRAIPHLFIYWRDVNHFPYVMLIRQIYRKIISVFQPLLPESDSKFDEAFFQLIDNNSSTLLHWIHSFVATTLISQ